MVVGRAVAAVMAKGMEGAAMVVAGLEAMAAAMAARMVAGTQEERMEEIREAAKVESRAVGAKAEMMEEGERVETVEETEVRGVRGEAGGKEVQSPAEAQRRSGWQHTHLDSWCLLGCNPRSARYSPPRKYSAQTPNPDTRSSVPTPSCFLAALESCQARH